VRFVADLHIHSYLSRATSKDLNLESLHRWSQLKGITVVGTGDFTHPRWFAELREKLVPAGGGLFRLRDDLARAVDAEVPAACRSPVRFLLSVEISNIYKRGDKVRKVHNLAYAPDFESAAKIASSLARIGNIESDGRPILGLDSRDLLEIVLGSSPDAFLIPAHIWTPWFSALGAQSGFDAISECYRDLAPQIFAAETGLSSDPAMNWRLSQLDRLALVSNSDAHSAQKLGREANLFDCDLSYFGLRDALRDRREGFLGTVEFFPEEGKYHYDGHRKCGVHLTPHETEVAQGNCPRCGKRLTAGVMSRVQQLADREEGAKPDGAKPFRSLVPLNEVIGEVVDTGPGSERVRRAYERILDRLGPELTVLSETPLEDIDREGPPLLSEAVRRMRLGTLQIRPGYDGEYGEVRLFEAEERRRLLSQMSFVLAGMTASKSEPREMLSFPQPGPLPEGEGARSPASGLNPEQLRAVEHAEGPLLVVAGPGTGKTRTIAHRIARLVRSHGVSPREITAITFTRKAAGELRDRLQATLGDAGAFVGAMTFHAFGLELLRAFPHAASLSPDFRVLGEAERLQVIEKVLSGSETNARTVSDAISRAKARLLRPREAEVETATTFAAYEGELTARDAVDFDDLVARAVRLLEADERARTWARERCRHLFVDEYQDINAAQYGLVHLLAPPEESPNICVVGDPDQAIYGFRGADPSLFSRFGKDYPGASIVELRQNHRSPACVVRAATHVIERSPGRPKRPLDPLEHQSPPIERLFAETGEDEAEIVVAEIEKAMGGTSLYSMDSGRVEGSDGASLAFHDVAVLYRLNAQAEPIEAALDRAGIPFQRIAGEPILARPPVMDLVARLTKLSESPKPGLVDDEKALARGVGKRRVAEIVERLYRTGREDAVRRQAADLLATLAVPFGLELDRFLNHLALLRETDLPFETQKVALLTLHAAKGLEFPIVFIVGCEDGLLPLRIPWLPPADIEEERRLLYVGMTRAKQRLVLTSARKRTLAGRQVEQPPSSFLNGLPAEWVTESKRGTRPSRPMQYRMW
jgi:DNA helicase II / ATP-dependent DNA helicase PcrA